MPVTLHATNYYVGTTTDQADGGDCTNASNTDCSLRDAVSAANVDATATSLSPHIINIPNGTYTITITGADYNNASGDYDVKNYVKFQGESQANTIIEGAVSKSRVFQDADTDAEMTFDSLTIRNGDSTALADKEGGCIRVDGNALVLNNVTMSNCTATYGGAIVVTNVVGGDVTTYNASFTNNRSTTSNGGAIAANGNTITVNATEFINNISGASYGGAISAHTVIVENGSVFKGNTAPANGGAIYAQVDITVSDSTFGGYGAGEGNSSNWGGALFLTVANQLLVERSVFIKNTANESGGAIAGYGGVIRSSVFEYNQANGANGGGALYSAQNNHYYINNDALGGVESRFSYNAATVGCGGAIRLNPSSANYKVTANNTTFNNNSAAQQGGAICAQIASNTALVDTDGSHYANNSAGWWGGAIFSRGHITITNASFDTNTSGGRGGAVTSWQNVIAKNATFYNNSTDGSYEPTQEFGGAIFGGLALTINNVTFADNVAADGGSAIYGGSGAPSNVIFYNSTAKNMNFCNASITNGGGNNLIYDGSAGSGVCYGTAGTGDVSGSNPALSALAFNGHPLTKTMAITAGSPAQEAGNNGSCESTDQRGTARPQNSVCDIGSYETTALPVTTVCASGCSYATIQAAINASANGDTIIVKDGVYSENINFNTKVITLQSQNGASVTTIQGDGSNAAVVTFADASLTSSTVLDGFTIDNQAASGTLARGILISTSANPSIKNSIINGNITSTSTFGGGVYISAASATIDSTTISNNTGADSGAAIYASALSATLTITGTSFSGNSGDNQGGALMITDSTAAGAVINNASFGGNSANYGGALYLNNNAGQTVNISNTSFDNNTANFHGGVIYLNNSAVSITGGSMGQTLANVSTQDGGAMYAVGAASSIAIDGSSIINNQARNGGAIMTDGAGDITITNSASIDANSANAVGGGLFIKSASGQTLTITDSSVSNNTSSLTTNGAGGGISFVAVTASNVDLTNVTMNGNTINGQGIDGGALYMSGAVTAAISGGSFNNNAARGGGGIYSLDNTSLTITGNTSINGNNATTVGGGGVYIKNPIGNVSISGATIQNNTASGAGAGILFTNINATSFALTNVTLDNNDVSGGVDGGNLVINAASTTATITGGSINHGAARHGSGIYAVGTSLNLSINGTVINSNITNGTSTTAIGGGVYLASGTLTLSDSKVQGNESSYAPGLMLKGNTTITNTLVAGNRALNASFDGGGILNGAGYALTIINSTIVGNYAGRNGGGILASGNETIKNTIIWGNTSGNSGPNISGTVESMTYSVVEGGVEDLVTNMIYVTDPKFVNLQVATSGSSTTAGDFHICYAAGDPVGCVSGPSSAFDTGTSIGAPSTDLDGISRPKGSAYDIGAYEAVVSGTSPSLSVTKASAVLSDPINGVTNPIRIPGAIVEYSVVTTNAGDASPDANSTIVIDVLDASSVEFDATTGIVFTDGATSSGLALGGIVYSSTPAPGPYSYDYTPVPVGGYDGNITSIKINTSGTFANGGSPVPSFILNYKVRIK